MRQEAHLQTFDLILKTRSPIFIGCGKSITNTEYIFDGSKNEVRFLDEEKFFTYLAEHGLADAYEAILWRKMAGTCVIFCRTSVGYPKASWNP